MTQEEKVAALDRDAARQANRAAAEKSLLDNSVNADFTETKLQDSEMEAKDRPPSSRKTSQEATPRDGGFMKSYSTRYLI